MVAHVLVAAIALGSMGASVARLRRLHQALRYDPGELAEALGRTGNRERFDELVSALRAEGPSWEQDLFLAIAASITEVERTALVNESLRDLDHELSAGA